MNKKRTRSAGRKPAVATDHLPGAPQGEASDMAGLMAQPDPIRPDDGRSRLFVEMRAAEIADEPVELELFAASDLPPVSQATVEAEPEPAAATEVETMAVPVEAAPTRATTFVMPASGPLGSRLRATREARGLTTSQVAQKLRIPAAKVAEMESEGFGQQDVSVFMRGYLKSYARLLELPPVIVTSALAQFDAHMPALVATQTVSRSHYLASRYGNSLVYIVLTAVVVVPLLWMARQGSLSSYGIPRMESLDTAASMVTAPVSSAGVESSVVEVGSQTQQEPIRNAEAATSFASDDPNWVETPPQPVRATMMSPMPAVESPVAAPATAPVSEGMQSIVLTLTQPSWVELKGADGRRIESALLPEGTRREYQVEGEGSLRIGNTRGATLEIDGAQVQLAPYTVGNVAHLKLGDQQPR